MSKPMNMAYLSQVFSMVFPHVDHLLAAFWPRKTYSATFGSAPKARDARSESPGPGAYVQNFSVRGRGRSGEMPKLNEGFNEISNSWS